MIENSSQQRQRNSAAVGLSSEEAAKRLRKYGENQLAAGKKRSRCRIFANQFKDLLVLILLAATVISLFLGQVYDALTIMIIVVINALLGYIQENRTEKTLEELEKMTAPSAKVYRDGELRVIPAAHIVPGDVFEIEAGDRIPCEGFVTEQKSLLCDEAILTGETVPVSKEEKGAREKLKGLNLPYVVYMGTTVSKGAARCEAFATGKDTQMGAVSNMLEDITAEETPLKKKLGELGKILALICGAVCVIVFAAGLLRGEPFFTMFMTSITIAIAAIPEGLPATVTIALALAIRRMLKRNALVKRLHSVETLGCAEVICSDKTGTITENKMTVTDICTYGREYSVSGTGYKIAGEIEPKFKNRTSRNDPALSELLKCGVLCSGSAISRRVRAESSRERKKIGEYEVVGDPTEIAVLVAAAKGGITAGELSKSYRRTDEIPFDSETRTMSVTVSGNGETAVYSKGAIDVLLSRCTKVLVPETGAKAPLTQYIRDKISDKANELCENALRVLAFSVKKQGEDETFLGFVGMIDKPRPEAKKAIQACISANIKVVMITGDHKLTACAVAKQAGLMHDGDLCLTGEELEKMTDEQLDKAVLKTAVFARVNPADKLRIVRSFKRNGLVTAMTGDGVNDAPAVKEADIGVSMGTTGTDVTKQAADLILLDDNFATLVCAVEQGRNIYSNIRKLVRYLISCNIGEVVTMFFSIVMGFPMVLLPTQILLVNLVTDGLPAISLGLEPTDPDVMRKKPRKSTDSFFSDGLLTKIIFRGMFIGLATLGCFVSVLKATEGFEAAARTAALVTLVMSQLIHVFECRSEEKSLFRINPFKNPWLVAAASISAAVMFACIYIPPLQAVFSTVALSGELLLKALMYAAAVPVGASLLGLFKTNK